MFAFISPCITSSHSSFVFLSRASRTDHGVHFPHVHAANAKCSSAKHSLLPPPHTPFLMLLLFFGFLNYRRRLYLLRITKGAEVSVASSEKNFHCSLVDLFVWLWRVSVKSFHRQSAGVGRCVFRIREGKVKEKQTRTCLHPMFIDTYSHRDKGTLHLVTDSPQ